MKNQCSSILVTTAQLMLDPSDESHYAQSNIYMYTSIVTFIVQTNPFNPDTLENNAKVSSLEKYPDITGLPQFICRSSEKSCNKSNCSIRHIA